ncbi:hypothetical protein GGX14DRAFT_396290 [Mycena pura]|uniref:Uncharacterized protein n=1 Tax=Mycena pura TaxID=153505 RepID=A0AAD6VAI1_9AGAR|nr:hypothetical protein GGX14DRAFT_396290 [Mycena pura]
MAVASADALALPDALLLLADACVCRAGPTAPRELAARAACLPACSVLSRWPLLRARDLHRLLDLRARDLRRLLDLQLRECGCPRTSRSVQRQCKPMRNCGGNAHPCATSQRRRAWCSMPHSRSWTLPPSERERRALEIAQLAAMARAAAADAERGGDLAGGVGRSRACTGAWCTHHCAHRWRAYCTWRRRMQSMRADAETHARGRRDACAPRSPSSRARGAPIAACTDARSARGGGRRRACSSESADTRTALRASGPRSESATQHTERSTRVVHAAAAADAEQAAQGTQSASGEWRLHADVPVYPKALLSLRSNAPRRSRCLPAQGARCAPIRQRAVQACAVGGGRPVGGRLLEVGRTWAQTAGLGAGSGPRCGYQARAYVAGSWKWVFPSTRVRGGHRRDERVAGGGKLVAAGEAQLVAGVSRFGRNELGSINCVKTRTFALMPRTHFLDRQEDIKLRHPKHVHPVQYRISQKDKTDKFRAESMTCEKLDRTNWSFPTE